jgi:hypothetical protein
VILSIDSLPRFAISHKINNHTFKIKFNPDWGDTGIFNLTINASDSTVTTSAKYTLRVIEQKRAKVTILGIGDSALVYLGTTSGWLGKKVCKGNGSISNICPGNYLISVCEPHKRQFVFPVSLLPSQDTIINLSLKPAVPVSFSSIDTLKSLNTPLVIPGLKSCVWEDITGDNLKDILAVRDNGNMEIYKNSGISYIFQKSISFHPDLQCLRVVDWDADGDIDILLGFFNGSIDILKSCGPLTYKDSLIHLTKSDSGLTGFSLEKLNDDSIPDLLLSFANGTFKTGKSSPSGFIFSSLCDIKNLPLQRSPFQALVSMDLTGDGKLDIITADKSDPLHWHKRVSDDITGINEILNGDGKAIFSPQTTSLSMFYDKDSDFPGIILTTNGGFILKSSGKLRGDINGDGIVDISDLQQLGLKWGLTETDNSWSDPVNLDIHKNSSGKQYIDLLDLTILGNCWGNTK